MLACDGRAGPRTRTMLFGVPASAVAAAWPRAWPLLAPAVARAGGRYDEASVRAALADRRQQLWLAERDGRPIAACVTEVLRYPGRTACMVVFCGGAVRGILAAGLARLEAWAKAQGCDFIELHGRPGWERVLPGYRRDYVALRKDV